MKKLAQFSILFATFFAVWSTSGTRPLAGSIMLVLSATAFVFSILNWGFDKKSNFAEIVKNPFFIGGGILTIMGVIQVLNPHTLAYDADGYLHARALSYIKWLPSGIKADAEVYGSAKAVAELLSAYFFASALWFHSKDAKFCKFLIKFFAINISVMSVFTIFQALLKAQAVYFLFASDTGFYGPYYYGNATCVAIFLGICATIGSFCLSFNLAKNLKDKAISFLWLMLVIPQILAIFMATSIGARMSVIIFAFFIIVISIFCFLKNKIGLPKTVFSIATLILVLTYPSFYLLNTQYNKLHHTKKASLTGRIELANIAKDVFFEAPILGSGADSFGYLAAKHKDKKFSKFANSAHNSILNYACEYGLAGVGSIFFVFCTWARRLFLRRKILCATNLVCLAGLATSTLHSMADIFLQIPSTMWFYALMMTLSASIFKGSKK